MAKRFRFPLETLLRVRELREREAKRKVGLKQAEIARIDQLVHQTYEEIDAHQKILRQRQQGTLAPAELVRERAWIAHLRGTIVQWQVQREQLVNESQVLREELRVARVQKRVIEKLRERRWEEYRKDRARREQAEADELAQQLHGFEIAR